MFVYASAVDEVNRILGFAEPFEALAQSITGVLVTLSFLYFFWGFVGYIRKGPDLEEAKKKIAWGILGIFVLMSVWGLIYLFQKTIIGNRTGAPPVEFLETTQ